jgi:hypothetical protein
MWCCADPVSEEPAASIFWSEVLMPTYRTTEPQIPYNRKVSHRRDSVSGNPEYGSSPAPAPPHGTDIK